MRLPYVSLGVLTLYLLRSPLISAIEEQDSEVVEPAQYEDLNFLNEVLDFVQTKNHVEAQGDGSTVVTEEAATGVSVGNSSEDIANSLEDLQRTEEEDTEFSIEAFNPNEIPEELGVAAASVEVNGEDSQQESESIEIHASNTDEGEVITEADLGEESVLKQNIHLDAGVHLNIIADDGDCEEEEQDDDDCEEEEEEDDCKGGFWFWPFASETNEEIPSYEKNGFVNYEDTFGSSSLDEDKNLGSLIEKQQKGHLKVQVSSGIVLGKAAPESHGLFASEKQQPETVKESTIALLPNGTYTKKKRKVVIKKIKQPRNATNASPPINRPQPRTKANDYYTDSLGAKVPIISIWSIIIGLIIVSIVSN